MSNPLITFSIPTWNRSHLLKHTLDSILMQVEGKVSMDQIEILVCDNASDDSTRIIVQEYKNKYNTTIRYYRHEKNVGVVKNILKTLELTRGKYWMFYGDDDLIPDNTLHKLLKAIADDKSVLFFYAEHFLNEYQDLNLEEMAYKFFYHLGNAGVFAIRSDLAKNVFKKYGEEAFTVSYWPQTQIGFLAMKESMQEQPVRWYPWASSSSPSHLKNTLYNSWYLFETCFMSLYRVAELLKPTLGSSFFSSAMRHLFEKNRRSSYFKSIYFHSTYFDNDTQLKQARQLSCEAMTKLNGYNIGFFSKIWIILFLPRWVKKSLFYLYDLALVCLGKTSIFPYIREMQSRQEEIRISKEKTKPRSYDIHNL